MSETGLEILVDFGDNWPRRSTCVSDKNVSYINDEHYEQHEVLGSLMAAKDEIKGRVLTSYSDILFDELILLQLLEFSGDIGIPVDLDWEKSYDGRTHHPKSEADNVLIRNKKILNSYLIKRKKL